VKERLWRRASLFMGTGDLVGQPGVGLPTVDFERWLEGALEVEHLSMGAL
jgi:hypothetical protein